MQARRALGAPRVGVRAPVQQQAEGPGLAGVGGPEQGRRAERAARVDVGPVVEEEPHQVLVAKECRAVQHVDPLAGGKARRQAVVLVIGDVRPDHLELLDHASPQRHRLQCAGRGGRGDVLQLLPAQRRREDLADVDVELFEVRRLQPELPPGAAFHELRLRVPRTVVVVGDAIPNLELVCVHAGLGIASGVVRQLVADSAEDVASNGIEMLVVQRAVLGDQVEVQAQICQLVDFKNAPDPLEGLRVLVHDHHPAVHGEAQRRVERGRGGVARKVLRGSVLIYSEKTDPEHHVRRVGHVNVVYLGTRPPAQCEHRFAKAMIPAMRDKVMDEAAARIHQFGIRALPRSRRNNAFGMLARKALRRRSDWPHDEFAERVHILGPFMVFCAPLQVRLVAPLGQPTALHERGFDLLNLSQGDAS
mmetsp:Transcript_8174/g.24236  ORF Transcript_8174/g.24236 Transcript_8174/m.24236 type:complete len:419 (-) Transcript_8174:482-1738(-)